MFMVFTIIMTSICTAQRIEMVKVFGGYKYSQEGKTLSMGKLVKTMESNPDAHVLIKKAQNNNILATMLGATGGVLVGYPIGTTLGGGKTNWLMVGIGAGLVIVGIPITSGAKKNTKKAIELYNASLPANSFFESKLDFKLSTTSNGIGFLVSF